MVVPFCDVPLSPLIGFPQIPHHLFDCRQCDTLTDVLDIVLGDPYVFIGDPYVFIGDPYVFIGDSYLVLGFHFLYLPILFALSAGSGEHRSGGNRAHSE